MRRQVFSTILALALCAWFPVAAGAAADGAPSVVASAPSQVVAGTSVQVSGTMTAATQPGATLWNDGTLAQDLPTFDYPSDPSIDLVQGSVEHAAPADPLTLRIKVNSGPEIPGRAYQWYRWSFQLEERWYFVEFTYVQDGASGGWRGSWYYCKLALGSNCIHGDTPPFPVTWDAPARTFTGRIPIRDLARVQPDGTLDQDTMRPFSSQYRPESGYKYPVATFGQDRAPQFTEFLLPIASVHLGIAPAGTPPWEVAFTRRATPSVAEGSMDVGYTGAVPTDGLAPGSYEVFVRGCFGPCTIAQVPVSITA